MEADLLDRVRKLLAKAEDEGCTPSEAEALTAKAAELMARYGIDRALLGALHPETDRPADRRFAFERPWADVKAHLLAAVATALRCQWVQTQTAEGSRLHVFGYSSDLERAEILYTSLLVQMARALAREPVPAAGNSAKAWRRSWMLGYCSAVVARIRVAEESGCVGVARRRRRDIRRAVGRAGARRPLAHGPDTGHGGLPAAEEEARHLLGRRLRGRLPRGPEGGYRRGEDQVARGWGTRPLIRRSGCSCVCLERTVETAARPARPLGGVGLHPSARQSPQSSHPLDLCTRQP